MARYRRDDPTRTQFAVHERAEIFVASRISAGVLPESIDHEVDIKFRVARLDEHEAMFLREVRRILGASRELGML